MTPAIKCLHDETWPLEKFVEHPKNPNRHPAGQIAILAQIIEKGGWRSPIVVSKRSGFVIKGHGRLAAAKFGKFTEAPVSLQDYENEAEEWADMIADNRIAELSERDSDTLLALVEEIQMATEVDLPQTGFTETEIQNMQLAQPRGAGDAERVVPDGTKGKSAPGKAIKFLTFGEYKFPLSEAEYEELVKRSDQHRAETGSHYGLINSILSLS